MRRALRGLTRRGRVFAAGGLLTGVAAVVAGSDDLLRVALLVLLLPLLSIVVALRSRVRLAAARSIAPQRAAVTTPATVRLTLQNLVRIPTGVLLVEDSLPYTLGTRPRFVLDHVWSRFRREVTYRVRADVRGRYVIGPLTVRLTDPFGLVEIRRAFSETSTLVVTPPIHPLPAVRLPGEWSGSGESRPRSIASEGDDDVTIRPYRHGDDMRRVHWRATAHHAELMVRREEQPWQSRATLLLDNRAAAHAGRGRDASLEWGVTAVASIGVHLSKRGYAIRLVTDDGTTVSSGWQDPGMGPVGAEGPLLDALAVVDGSRQASVGRWPELLTGSNSASGLLIAVLGRLRPQEAAVVANLRHAATAALAVVVDANSWRSLSESARNNENVQLTETTQLLRRAGWGVVQAGRGDRVADIWERLGTSYIDLSGPPPPNGDHASSVRHAGSTP
ncbi:MAG: DUF58 domain-containing protein [Actinomycetota bacterium]